MKMITTKSFDIAVNTAGDENADRIAILMPGRLDTKDYVNFVSHSNFLARHGYYAIAIDPPGTWESGGDISSYSTTNYLQAINELIDVFGNRPTLLLGHSRGGATAMLASQNPAVSALVVVNAAYGSPHLPNPDRIKDGVYHGSRDVPPGATRTVERRLFDLPMAYFEDGKKYDPARSLTAFQGPKLIIHATQDEFVTMQKVREIYEQIAQPKMFLEIDCTHDYRLYPTAITDVETSLGQFITKYL